MIVPNLSNRGTFIVFEGVDRCGKTTQCGLLLKHLLGLGMAAVAMQFPDRTTLVGQLINSYLASNEHLDDRAIHLLFSANRWEAAPTLAETLARGETVICDRYAYSGVAFSSAKEAVGDCEPLTIEWCKSSDVGLPAPDVVIFLDLSQEEAEQRGGYVLCVVLFSPLSICSSSLELSHPCMFVHSFMTDTATRDMKSAICKCASSNDFQN